jgi:hypothetical protein
MNVHKEKEIELFPVEHPVGGGWARGRGDGATTELSSDSTRKSSARPPGGHFVKQGGTHRHVTSLAVTLSGSCYKSH